MYNVPVYAQDRNEASAVGENNFSKEHDESALVVKLIFWEKW